MTTSAIITGLTCKGREGQASTREEAKDLRVGPEQTLREAQRLSRGVCHVTKSTEPDDTCPVASDLRQSQ